MPVFVKSTTSVNRHGAFAIEATPPTVIRSTGTGVAALVGQFPWGPDATLYTPTGPADLVNTFAPAGMSRSGAGYCAMTKKAFPTLKVVRVLGAGAAKATASLPDAVPDNIIKVDLKYEGAAGNSVTWQVKAASDGDANHFDLVVSMTGASGTTTDTIQNLNFSGTGADSVLTQAQLASLKLVGAIAKLAAGRPANATGTFATGSDGAAVGSADYIGTPGSPDKGISLLETDKSIRVCFVDDPGNTLRAAVNAGLVAHVDKMGNRICYISGNSGQSQAQAKTDKANYSDDRVYYVDPWVYQYDGTGNKVLVPGVSFAGSVRTQLSPSTAIAWKSAEVGQMMNGIVGLEANRGDAAGDNTDAGIVTIIAEDDGGFRFEADVATVAPADPTKRRGTRRVMADFIAISITSSLRGNVDAPNVSTNQQDVVQATHDFLLGLKKAASSRDPNHTPHVIDFDIAPLDSVNDATTQGNGDFFVPIDVRTSAGMERIFLLANLGEGVVVAS